MELWSTILVRHRLRSGAKGKGDQTTVWHDELHARGPEMAAAGNSRWRAVEAAGVQQRAVGEIVVACSQRVVAIEVGEA